MRLSLSIATLIAVAAAIPAPQVVTVVQVTTQVINEDGSIYTGVPIAAAAAAAPTGTTVAAVVATPAATSAASSSSSSSTGSSLYSWFKNFLGSYLDDDSDTTVAETQAASTPSVATVAASKSAIAYAALLETTSSTPAYSVAYTPATLSTKTTSKAAALTSLASPSSGSSSGSGADSSFASAILDAHNKVRALHSAPALTWDADAYNYAQNYADAYDCSGVLTHSHGPYGENLACGYKDGPSALTAWYDEGQSYNYQSANSYDHFTQVVWKDTTKVGCAYKDCRSNNWGLYIICSYDPAGNVVGQSAANVLQD